MSEEMKGGGWEGVGDGTDVGDDCEFLNYLQNNAKNGIVLNGVVAWIDIQQDRIANEIWMNQAIVKYTDEEVTNAKADLWKAAAKALEEDVRVRKGENKKRNDIDDIHVALGKLRNLNATPLIIANSKMVAHMPPFGGLKEDSDISDVINKVKVLENSLNSFINWVLLPTRCFYQPGVVINRVMLAPGCYYQPGVVTSWVLLPTGCCYQLGVVTEWVLLPTWCCYQTSFVTNLVLLPTGCCCHPGVVTNRMLLQMGCCYQHGVVTYRVLLPNCCCYQMGVVTKGVLIPNRCCYQTGFVTKRVLLTTRYC